MLTMNDMIQRGFARAVIRDSHIAVEPTVEYQAILITLEAGGRVPCIKCGAPYPKPAMVPKYSQCQECRKGHPVVDFIARPQ